MNGNPWNVCFHCCCARAESVWTGSPDGFPPARALRTQHHPRPDVPVPIPAPAR